MVFAFMKFRAEDQWFNSDEIKNSQWKEKMPRQLVTSYCISSIKINSLNGKGSQWNGNDFT